MAKNSKTKKPLSEERRAKRVLWSQGRSAGELRIYSPEEVKELAAAVAPSGALRPDLKETYARVRAAREKRLAKDAPKPSE